MVAGLRLDFSVEIAHIYTGMSTLKPLKLHNLIAGSTAWSDELWDRALAYLLERTSTPDALVMAEVIGSHERPWLVHKIDHLREFRDFPPTVLLGAFDWMRYQKAVRQHPGINIAVEQRPSSYYSIAGLGQ